ncbi:MAG TPA: hypothetical protein VGD09_16555 [Blastococcus sp.]|jgi:hypothetical protein
MSHPDPALFDVRTVADHPLIDNGPTSSLRIVAPGSVTAGRYGLFEYRLAPHSPRAEPHVHRVLPDPLRARHRARAVLPRDRRAAPERQVMVDG